MLTINNIDILKHKTIGAWNIVEVLINRRTTHIPSIHNYTIRLSRNETGAAIVIERTSGQYGYNVSICYEHYDDVICINAFSKKELMNKDTFFGKMQGLLDVEYDKRN